MSFDTWHDEYPDTLEYIEGMRAAFEAGRAESEAERLAAIDAVCKRWVTYLNSPDYRQPTLPVAEINMLVRAGSLPGAYKSLDNAEIAALKAERDALRTILERVQFEGQDGECPSCGHLQRSGHGKYCELAAALNFSAPASGKPVGCFLGDCRIVGPHRHDGEPARKP